MGCDLGNICAKAERAKPVKNVKKSLLHDMWMTETGHLTSSLPFRIVRVVDNLLYSVSEPDAAKP
jgi:hypothetical protein